jgi:NCS1 family nucleobase:cation symporter-1
LRILITARLPFALLGRPRYALDKGLPAGKRPRLDDLGGRTDVGQAGTVENSRRRGCVEASPGARVGRVTIPSGGPLAANLRTVRAYGDSATQIEPGGIEWIPDDERHGNPWQLLTTWASPNLEFATVFVGIIGVLYFGLSFWMTLIAVSVGNALAALSHGVLSAWGPRHGLAQMVLSRTGFGYRGNVLPAALTAIMAGVGWFAVNSISAAYALSSLTELNLKTSLTLIIVIEVAVAIFGYNLIHMFQRMAFPILGIAFVLAGISVFSRAELSVAGSASSTMGPFLIEVAAAFGCAAGWNPYASDYSRYLRPRDSRSAGIAAGLGLFFSSTALMAIGAASATITIPGLAGNATPTDAFTYNMPPVTSFLTLGAITIGAVSANVLNIYSGAMSFLAVGVQIPFRLRRAMIAAAFGICGGLISMRYLRQPDAYENFLLIIAYWIGPWLGVVLADRALRRGSGDDMITATAQLVAYRNRAGPIAFSVATVVSIWLFSRQEIYTGFLVRAHPALGDFTFFAGFSVAAILYVILKRLPLARRGRLPDGAVR